MAIDAVRLLNYTACRIKKVLPASAAGQIAPLDGVVVFVSLGRSSGIESRQILDVYRGEAEIKDPDTGKVLGKKRRKVARIEATTVENELTKAKLIGELDLKLEIGDQVELAALNNAVAIFPLIDAEDRETVGTNGLPWN